MYTGPNIITDGLVLALDAANSKSYPGSGTTWYDLSGNGNNGTLTNGPTFDSGNKGSIDFDGTNDAVLADNIPINTDLTGGNTVEQWIYWDGGTPEMPFSWFDISFDILIFNSMIGINNDSALVYGTSTPELAGRWAYYACFFPNNWSSRYQDAKFWLDGQERSMSILNGSLNNRTIPANPTISIGSGYNGTIDYNFGGKIAITNLYNRALSTSEVQQNYNAIKSRFK